MLDGINVRLEDLITVSEGFVCELVGAASVFSLSPVPRALAGRLAGMFAILFCLWLEKIAQLNSSVSQGDDLACQQCFAPLQAPAPASLQEAALI